MPTYEALADTHVRLDLEFKRMNAEADALLRISKSILELMKDGVLDLEGRRDGYVQRTELASRRILVARRIGGESLGEIDQVLRRVELMRMRRDIAFDLNEMQMVQDNETGIARDLELVRLETESLFALVAHYELALKLLAPPRFVVG